MQMMGTRLRYFMIKSYPDGKVCNVTIGKVCVNPYFLFLKVLVFQERFYIVTNFKLFLLLWFNFSFFMLGSSEEFDSHVTAPCFFSICAIAPLIICFD